jgi:adenine phosphoribosyltransferase
VVDPAARPGAAGHVAGEAAQRLLWSRVRDVPDWPEPGVLFRDLTPLMADADAFGTAVDLMTVVLGRGRVDVVVGIEARGFPYAAALAYHLGAGFVTLRKPGKLPGDVHREEYDLEYGSAALELHRDAVGPGSRVVIVDDVLATGGTACAAIDLVRRTGAEILRFAVIMDLPTLGGADRVRARGVGVAALLDGDAPVH